MLTIGIHYNHKINIANGNELGFNLDDLVVSLAKNLKKRHAASLTASDSPGLLEMKVSGTDAGTVKPYIEAFQVSMVRHNVKPSFLISYSFSP